MFGLEKPEFAIPLAFLTALAVTTIAIPSIINVAKIKHLFDKPGARKSHRSNIPTLGGIAIFGGFIIALTMWGNMMELKLLQYVLAASCLIFLIGAKDDIIEIDAYKKFIGQILATLIIVVLGGLRFTSFHDLFGGGEVPYWASVIITSFTILVIINSFNLIDGINALSGTIGAIICTAFGIYFFMRADYQMVVLCAALLGALLAFLRYNVSPATIFMGDTGSLLLGLLFAVMAIRFVEINGDPTAPFHIQSVPAVSIGFLVIPLFDLLRAFSIRISRGRSPFSPDRNHLHHMLLDCGLSHMQATYILAAFHIGFIVLALQLQHIGSWPLIGILLGSALVLSTVLFKIKKNYRKQRKLKQAQA